MEIETVSITADDKFLIYNPGSLEPGDTDEIHYEIEDEDGLTDDATVYIQIEDSGSVGNVTATFSDADVSGDDTTSIAPAYDANDDGTFSAGETLGTLSPEQSADTGWNVVLYEDARIFAIEKEDIDLPEGHEFVESDTVNWILKEVPVDDFTGQQNTAELGKSY